MGIKTARAEGYAEVRIDDEKCNGCGLCVKVCKGAPLYMEGGRVRVDQSRYFGCIACGHCMAICPHDAITIEGRDMSAADALPFPAKDAQASYEQIQNLMLARRSVRNFQNRPVPRETVEQIVASAATAPMGLPPTDVGLLVLDGKEKVRQFRDDAWRTLKSWRPFTSPLVLFVLRPFIGKENYEMFKTFIGPALDAYEEMGRQGVDWFFYGAPLAMCFYGSAYSDPADPVIAATYAMLAGEAVGLGTCMLGFPGYALRYDKKLRAKYHLPAKIQPGIVVIFGYPAVRWQHAIKRRLAEVKYA